MHNPDTDAFLAVPRPGVEPFSFSAPYWEATREKRLKIQYCPVSGQYQFPPRPVSLFTGRTHLEWREVPGKGVVFAHMVARLGTPALRGVAPYIVATVTLDEGVNVIGNLVDCSLDDVFIGMRVKPEWAPQADGTHLLMFRPDGPDSIQS